MSKKNTYCLQNPSQFSSDRTLFWPYKQEKLRFYEVEKGSNFLDSTGFYKFFHSVGYYVLVPKSQWIVSKNKIIATGVASQKWNFLTVLYNINNSRICPYTVPMANAPNFCGSFFLRLLCSLRYWKSKVWESISKSLDKEWKGDYASKDYASLRQCRMWEIGFDRHSETED